MDLLLLLQDGPKEKETILEKLGISSQKLSPQLTELTQSKIVACQDDNYVLTNMGNLLVTEISSMIEVLKFFHEDYWWNHRFNSIPSFLLTRLTRIKGWNLEKLDLPAVYEYNKEIHKETLLSTSASVFISTLPPLFFELAFEMQEKKVNLSIIFDVNLFNKIKSDNAEPIKKLINSEDCKVYTYPESSDLVLFLVNDSSLIFRLLTNEGTLDNKRLINRSQEAVQWGKELFEYHLKDSTQITEI